MSKANQDVATQLTQQHAVHGILGSVFERWGGTERVLEWADENPGRYITLLLKTVPNMTPINHIQGDVNLVVHNTLGPTSLDGPIVDEQ